MSENKEYKPGQIADQNLSLNVLDHSGKKMGAINVKEGETIPPYRTSEQNVVSKYVSK